MPLHVDSVTSGHEHAHGYGSLNTLPARISYWWLPGGVAITLILLFTALPFVALLFVAGDLPFHDVLSNSYTQRVIRFSLYQALLSTVLSIGLAIPVARALARETSFPGRSLLINLFSLSLVIPTIVAIFGIVAVYGRTGWLNEIIAALGADRVSIYGLSGILLAHVFFNMPLAARVLLQIFDGIPEEHWRLSTQLGMRSLAQFRFIEWPAIRSQLAGLAILIFTLCFTSFAIVMTLGGGPKATTIEVAIYQSLRFDFDIAKAVTLALVQLFLCAILMLASATIGQSHPTGFNYRRAQAGFRPTQSVALRIVNVMIIVLATGFVLLPLAGMLISAINPAFGNVLLHAQTQTAIVNTIVVSLSAASISLLIGIGLLISTRHIRLRFNQLKVSQWVQLLGNVILVFPPVVLGTGLFLLLRPYADVFGIALILVIIINSLMALPFVLRILEGPMIKAAQQHDTVIRSLGIEGLNRWRLLDWPVLKKPIGLCMALATTLAAGDLSAIALFGSEQVTTLPLLLYQRMGSYRMQDAAATAVLLLILCLLLFCLFQWLFGREHHAES